MQTRPAVHILCSCPNPELLDATLLVFKTLRVGFPTAEVHAHFNAELPLTPWLEPAREAARKVGATIHGCRPTIHHSWIRDLMFHAKGPFIICDTDMVFHESVENFDYTNCHLCGPLIPQFYCSFAKAITRPRLHGCFLYFNPEKIRSRIKEFESHLNLNRFTPLADYINPLLLPLNGKMVFWDTCAMLHEAIGGTPHTEAQLDCYSHLHNGTISDMVAPCYPELSMRQAHAAVMENPSLSKGIWRQQAEFYEKRRVEL